MAEPKKYKFLFRINPDICMSCAACELECRDDGIYVDETVHYAINVENCTRCGRCFRACPANAISRVSTA